MALRVSPIALREANAFVAQHHRHARPARGCLFCVAVVCDGQVVGVAIVGRPVARGLDDRETAEVTRLCTNGTRNACSMLYRAAWRAARAIGYRRLVTYTLEHEDGASLRAAGMSRAGRTGGGSWSCPSRPRIDKHATGPKMRWELHA